MGAKTYRMSESDHLHSTDDLVGWLTRLITRYAGLVFEQADVKRKGILYDAINYMKQHLGERFTLEDTARQVGFSPNYFSKVFKDEMGCTFSYYLGKLRIDRSKALLLVSKLSIREICDAVGYEEQSYFIKVFTRFTGVTPGNSEKGAGGWTAVKSATPPLSKKKGGADYEYVKRDFRGYAEGQGPDRH